MLRIIRGITLFVRDVCTSWHEATCNPNEKKTKYVNNIIVRVCGYEETDVFILSRYTPNNYLGDGFIYGCIYIHICQASVR